MKATSRKKVGRPSKYTPDTSRKFLTRLARGMSVPEACAAVGMPSEARVYVWLSERPEFQEGYARACAHRAEFWANQIVTLADECTDPAKARLQIDARKWVASKLLPKKYGDKLDIEHSGSVDIEVTIGGDDAD